MKKNIVRIVAALLVAMLALTLIPLGAFAATTVDVYDEYYGKTDPKWKDFDKNTTWYYNETIEKPSVTIKTSDYDKHVIFDGELFDLKGVFDWDDNGNEKKKIKMYSSLTFNDGDQHDVSLGYVPHQHKLSRWYSDECNHWRECLICKQFCAEGFHDKFMYMNWHSDGDEDRVCDVCDADIPYHDVTVIESEGGKITVNEVEAPYRKKIVANVEAAEGYTFKSLHFTKVRDNGTRQEVTRYKNAEGFWTEMPNYELEVSAEFVKKK